MITSMMDKKSIKKEQDNKRRKAKWGNLNVDQKEQLRNKRKKKKDIQDNLDDEQKEHLKIGDNKKEKEKAFMLMKKNSWGNTRKKERMLCIITSIMIKKNIRKYRKAKEKNKAWKPW